MLEIVNDIAPGAQLFFATANTSQASFARTFWRCALRLRHHRGRRWLLSRAVFADDNVAQSVNSVTSGGGLYFSSVVTKATG